MNIRGESKLDRTRGHGYQSTTMKQIKRFFGPEFEQALDIYSSSFPAIETKPIQKVKRTLGNDSNYQLYVAMVEHSVVGMSLVYLFPSLGVGLLDYMAVIPSYRGKGIGTQMFKYAINKCRTQIPQPTGMLLEVQRENFGDSEERKVRIDRIRFYARLGAKILEGVSYLLPPQTGTEPEDMYLMIVLFKKMRFLRKESVLRYIRAIYTNVYQYTGEGLIDKTSQTLPNTIRLRDTKVVLEKIKSDW